MDWTLIVKKVLAVIIVYPIVLAITFAGMYIRRLMFLKNTEEMQKYNKKLMIFMIPACFVITVLGVIFLWKI